MLIDNAYYHYCHVILKCYEIIESNVNVMFTVRPIGELYYIVSPKYQFLANMRMY